MIVDDALVYGARQILGAKLALYATLPTGYVRDAAIPVLLTLFVAEVDGVPVRHSEICEAAMTATPSAAAHWIKALERDGFVRIVGGAPGIGDPIVALTGKGQNLVASMVASVGETQARLHRQDSISDQRRNFDPKTNWLV